MSRRSMHSLGDDELGRVVAGLDLGWPEPSAGLTAEVLARIHEGDRGSRRWSRARVVLLVAAAILLLATAAVAARLVFDVGAITIEPAPTDRPLPTASVIPDLGRAVTLEQAEALTGTDAAVPTLLGPPDRVWIDTPEDVPEGAAPWRIVMAWRPRPDLPAIPGSPFGVVLIRWDAHVAAGVKLVGGHFEHVTVEGWPEAFRVIDPHELVLFTDDGPVRVLVRGDVLLWGDETTTFRLESELPRQEAFAVAESTP